MKNIRIIKLNKTDNIGDVVCKNDANKIIE